jgi:hypothetical protein
MHTIDKDGVASVTFAEAIRSSAKAEIEQYRLVGSWQGDGQYWVYYELSRANYDAYMEARRQKAIRDGFDFWYRGHTLLAQGDLNSAVELLLKAMEVIEPAINQELLCSYDGKTINLGMEVYASLTSLFTNVSVVLNPTTLSVVPFKGITDPIAIGVYRNGTPLKNIHLTADFLSGEGDLSEPAPTNEEGVSALYIRNITSKQAQQHIRVKMQDAPFAPYLKSAYAAIFSKVLATLPEAQLTLNLAATPVVAYMHTLPGSLEGVSHSIGSLLTNNFFSVTNTPYGADVTVTTETRLRLGRIVPGELYNFKEYFASVNIKMVDNRTRQEVLNYSVNDLRTLVPENNSDAQAQSMATRELLKRIQRELPAKLKAITIDRTGELPSVSVPPSPAPVVDTVRVVVPVPVPVSPSPPQPTPVRPKPAPVQGELTDGIFVQFDRLSTMNNKSRIHFKVINRRADDFKLRMYVKTQTVVNESGAEMKVSLIRLGSQKGTYSVEALIVPHVPTELIIEVGKLRSVALYEMVDRERRTLKLRNLK